MNPQKTHTACDACRARKLKCSGEPTGCERCIRDGDGGARCHYSVQKPMGRPRKRRREEEEEAVEVVETSRVLGEDGMVELGGTLGEEGAMAGLGGMLGAGLEMGGGMEAGIEEFSWLDSELGLLDMPTPSPATEVEIEVELSPELGLEVVRQASPPTPQLSFPPTPSSFPLPSFTPAFPSFPLPMCTLFTSLPTTPPCPCLPTLLTHITTLTSTPPASLTLPTTLTLSRSVLAATNTSIACPGCIANPMSAYTMNLLFGVALPQLVVVLRHALGNIEAVRGGQRVCVGAEGIGAGGVEVLMDAPQWREMARGAVAAEVRALLECCGRIERRSWERHPEFRLQDKETGGGAGGRMRTGTGGKEESKEGLPMCLVLLGNVRQIVGLLPVEAT
ncbi:hypothetical protein EDC01DRAFT_785923 [Geopyxis carbonaria]|nr:hypothetical protein EDC01DRAFT_785923 [Geopyxis carbonaria]